MSWKKNNIWNDSYIKKVIDSNRLAHAYLFLGHDQQKKIWSAFSIAKALFCSEPGASYCDMCPACKKVESHNHPDIYWVRPTGAMRLVKIDELREMQNFLSLKSYEGGKKIAFIMDADRMREDGANAILKTIEEPSSQTLLILFAKSIEGFLPTILSRCQKVYFPNSDTSEILEYLKDELNVEDQTASLVSMLARGNYSTANLYMDDERREWRDYVVDSIFNLFSGKGDTFLLASKISSGMSEISKKKNQFSVAETGLPDDKSVELTEMEKKALEKNMLNEEVATFFQFVESCCRDIIIYQETLNSNLLINIDKLDYIKNISNKFNLNSVNRFLIDIETAYKDFQGNTNLTFVLEILFDKFQSEIDSVISVKK